ncbi:6,7-dimethyl-8-ribityllumazine synthase [Candidatus Accumulibacter sp. ACC003]|uniref:6,7-dimethyl-8-ribityllumazine synthase n=1 Tax=Candidatus Accumulibacter sp. ACC003 TaxID=2823334 RepID=UPI0025C029F2|nr:6,7-dimethyl-8-ribityllumazine synthase [Candidatus Accumulibacter sp. ACC003]
MTTQKASEPSVRTAPAARSGNACEYEASLRGAGLLIGVVMSRFSENIGEGLLSACTNELKRLGVDDSSVSLATVPGALEIPLTLQTMARSGRFDALIALGAVIRGETYHFEVVANDSCRALMDVQLATGVPVANGILTCEDDDQALVRMHQKGTDCARVAVEMANLLQALGEQS